MQVKTVSSILPTPRRPLPAASVSLCSAALVREQQNQTPGSSGGGATDRPVQRRPWSRYRAGAGLRCAITRRRQQETRQPAGKSASCGLRAPARWQKDASGACCIGQSAHRPASARSVFPRFTRSHGQAGVCAAAAADDDEFLCRSVRLRLLGLSSPPAPWLWTRQRRRRSTTNQPGGSNSLPRRSVGPPRSILGRPDRPADRAGDQSASPSRLGRLRRS